MRPSYLCSEPSLFPSTSLLLAPACLMPLLAVPGGHTTHMRMITRCDSTWNSGYVLSPGQSAWQFVTVITVMSLRATSLFQVLFITVSVGFAVSYWPEI